MNAKQIWKNIISSNKVIVTLSVVVCLAIFFSIFYYAYGLSVTQSVCLSPVPFGFLGLVILLDHTVFEWLRQWFDAREIAKNKKKDKLKAQNFYEKVESGIIKPTWGELYFMVSNLNLDDREKAFLLTKVNFIDLFEISNEKKHFKWHDLDGYLRMINNAVVSTFDDDIIRKLITPIKEMQKYRYYNGYDSFYKKVNNKDYKTLSKLVSLAPPIS